MHLSAVLHARLCNVVRLVDSVWCWRPSQVHHIVEDVSTRSSCLHCQTPRSQGTWCIVKNFIQLIVQQWSVLSRFDMCMTNHYKIQLFNFEIERTLNPTLGSATLYGKHFLVMTVVQCHYGSHTRRNLLSSVSWWGIVLCNPYDRF